MTDPNTELLQKRIAQFLVEEQKIVDKKGGGGHNTPMDLDTRLARIEGDIRHLLVGICVSFVILAGAIAISHMALSKQIADNSAYTAEHMGELKGMLSVLIDKKR